MNTLQKLYKMQNSDITECEQTSMDAVNFSSLSEYVNILISVVK